VVVNAVAELAMSSLATSGLKTQAILLKNKH
jgi:hypothetical protein